MGKDSQIVHDAVRDKQGALEALIKYYYNDAFYFALSKVGAQEAEEITQQAMLRIVQNICTLKDETAFKAWMFRIVNNEIFMRARKNKHDSNGDFDEELIETLPDEDENFLPEEYLLDEEKRKLVVETIRELPADYSDCIVLYYFEEMSYNEIADTLQVPETRVRNSLYRGKSLFKKLLEQKAGKEFATAPAFIPAAGLAQIFHQDAQTYATVDGVERCIDFVQNTPAETVTSNVAAASSGILKPLIGAGLAVVGIGVAVGVGIMTNQPEPELVPTPVIEQPTTQEEAPELIINTVGDMIGEEEAQQLYSYADQTVDHQSWLSFLQANNLEIEDSAADDDRTYQLYSLQKQDKQLLLIQRSIPGSDALEVRYIFGSTQEIPPLIRLIMNFDTL